MINKYNIKYYLCLLLAVLIPFTNKFIPAIIAVWIIVWLIEGNYRTKFLELWNNKLNLLFILFFVLHLSSLIYTDNVDSGLFDLEVKLSILIFPLILTGFEISKSKFLFLLKIFVGANLLAVLVCFTNGLYNYFTFDSLYKLYYYNFSVFHHTSYTALYVLFSISIIIYLFFSKNLRKGHYLYYIIAFIVFLSSLYFISARSGLLSMFIILLFTFILIIKKLKHKIISIGLLLVFIVSTFLFLSTNRRMNIYFDKSKQLIKDALNGDFNKDSDTRIQLWYSGIKLIAEHPITGVGIGDVKDRLNETYREKGFDLGIKKNFNVHNQFLDTYIGTGLLGFLVLLMILILPIFKFKNKYYNLIIMFLMIIMINFMFESMLNRQAGVVFFSFFYVLLVRKKNYE